MAMNSPIITRSSDPVTTHKLTDLERFKKLLEYFVAHLEYVANDKNDSSIKGYNYVKDLTDGSFAGQGYKYYNQYSKGGKIQKRILELDTYNRGKICISVDSDFKGRSKKSYLHWLGTIRMINISALWNQSKTRIESLRITVQDNKKDKIDEINVSSIDDLGLYDNQAPNQNIKKMFDEYIEQKKIYDMSINNIEYMNNVLDILKANHNIILNGAPGTGKTYLAKEIAKVITQGEEENIEMVQFHPSYDYSDFVEGLRPKVDNNGNIVFEREDGIFKQFCKKAIKSKENIIDNFEESWDKLVDYLNANDYLEISLLTKGTMLIELNEYGNGLANRTYPDGKYVKGNWIKGASKFFNRDQLYKVYKGLKGVPGGGFDNYRRAIINQMKKQFDLNEYTNTSNDTNQNFVFIIDEINRGEISKIFGELFFSIDPGYRGEKGRVKTQYQNLINDDNDVFSDGFYVPENVYIIGTMNNIDRSVESMDFAMRRRFAWKEITAQDSQVIIENSEIINKNDELKSLIINRMNNLNQDIISDDINLSKDYQIGAAYFKKIEQYIPDDFKQEGNNTLDTEQLFNKLWTNHLVVVLRDYLRGEENAEDKLDKLKKAYNGNQKH